jgi:ribosomal protein S15P/S13E
MTTPQNQLYYLAERINDLHKMFKDNSEDGDIFEKIKQIELQMQNIMTAQQRQENLMNLLIQLLSKKGK